MGDEAANSKNEVHELENWRIRIRREEGCADKWEDWWGWMVKVRCCCCGTALRCLCPRL
jgi:hypothetical protein